jgi:hypothetical protein|tara:strand:+ start:953 stop:1165 length:213 start_codon:yes stop_codon:yes gene_type:complete
MKGRAQITRIYADDVFQWIHDLDLTQSRNLKMEGGFDKHLWNFEFFLRVLAVSREVFFNTNKYIGLLRRA